MIRRHRKGTRGGKGGRFAPSERPETTETAPGVNLGMEAVDEDDPLEAELAELYRTHNADAVSRTRDVCTSDDLAASLTDTMQKMPPRLRAARQSGKLDFRLEPFAIQADNFGHPEQWWPAVKMTICELGAEGVKRALVEYIDTSRQYAQSSEAQKISESIVKQVLASA